jgi:hypothetical protein
MVMPARITYTHLWIRRPRRSSFCFPILTVLSYLSLSHDDQLPKHQSAGEILTYNQGVVPGS